MSRDRRWHTLGLAFVAICLTGVPARGTQIQGTTVPDGRGAVSGVVRDASSGRPIAGAVVTLSMDILVPNAPTIRGASRQVTDPAGRFVFTTLPAAGYTIAATKLGYFDGGYGRASQRAGNRRIALTDGQWFQDADIRLWRQTSISGAVLDEVGEPVAGTWVATLAQILVSGQPHWVSGPVTKTDDRGMYRFAGLTPGRWTVIVPSVQMAVPADTSIYTLSGFTPESAAAMEAAGRSPAFRRDPAVALDDRHHLLLGTSATPPPAANGRPQVYPVTYYPSTRALSEAVVVDTSDGDGRAGIDIGLRPVPAFRVSGVLEGPPEAVSGLILRLMPEGSESLGSGHEAATTLVEANGAFAFLNVPAGVYTIAASRSTAGYTYNPSTLLMSGTMPRPPGQISSMSASAVFSAPQGTMFRTEGQASGAMFAGRTRVEVGNVDLANVVVLMERESAISGRIVREATPGAAAPSGLPVMSVAAEPAGGDPALGQPRAAINRSDPSPTFRIEGLQRGEYLIRTAGGGMIKSVIHDGKDYTYRPFDASSGQDIAGVVITLTDQPAQLAGTVRDPQGRPVTSNAVAICFPAERDQWSRYGLQPMRLRAVTVANDGAFRITALPAGDYLVIAVDDEYADAWKDPAFLAKVATSAAKVTLGWGEAKHQNLTLVQAR
jgi:protocatechuate 3,4-dioxygenase beta subunit